jgi:hypothetical protein
VLPAPRDAVDEELVPLTSDDHEPVSVPYASRQLCQDPRLEPLPPQARDIPRTVRTFLARVLLRRIDDRGKTGGPVGVMDHRDAYRFALLDERACEEHDVGEIGRRAQLAIRAISEPVRQDIARIPESHRVAPYVRLSAAFRA